ncbi:uncharacterized protein MELLADRAFT_108242 [Melampsora larici-populina 98AG31]|uniref:Mitochondrial K+-H+ exchange-related-domain-containing protein n=1 Tax=Melampsora larici-populina (strain 98AG31 / pathotype 3-4-7) TaxID=747676 RepID=F4RSF9_MELLP|nr:uncharacterized protein MELLADRAFT_108242 [Melampsora larici-populina 98AG31]EGG04699.1 hypothetical protein MELLADRAFT_108242 [Melampsora larici-populina 98AG31]
MKKEAIKLIALPLTRPKPTESYGLIYLYHHNPNLNSNSNLTSTTTTNQQKAWVNRMTDFGAKQWLKMGTASKTNWKYKIYMTGEGLMDKIPFEEWAMKSIEPSAVPNTRLSNLEANHPEEKSIKSSESIDPIELLYPSLLGPSEKLIDWLKSTLRQKEPFHQKWMKYNLLMSPLTLPFAILPIVPNLPFFYLMWRAWSHWRAYRAIKYLNTMMSHGLIIPRQSKLLDKVYNESSLSKEGKDGMVLDTEMSLRLKEEFQWNEHCEREIERAIHQAHSRLKTNENRNENENEKEKTS